MAASSQSAVSDITPDKIDIKELPRFMGVLYNSSTDPNGMCWRFKDDLVTARHQCMAALGGTVCTAKGKAVAPISTERENWGDKHFEFTYCDMVSCTMPGQFWSLCGMRTTGKQQLSTRMPNSLFAYGVTVDGITRSQGAFQIAGSEKTRKLGTFAHNITIRGGYSGSPIVGRKDGQQCVVGMHICGDIFRDGCNYGVSTPCMLAYFKKHNMLPKPIAESLLRTGAGSESIDAASHHTASQSRSLQ